jgi:gamma-glutamylcyclotransferase (GGCT)/AIG2-like uncharacterized protein YtfP
MPPGTGLLFVYGTLRPRASTPWSLRLQADTLSWEPATVRGLLLRIGPYGGLVEGDGLVHGDLLHITNAEEWFQRLDEYEGQEYGRVETPVRCVSGREAVAWAYWYTGPRGAYLPIASGEWSPEPDGTA